jgi:hypothetical protein
MKLVVTTAFADYQVGDEITDADTVKTILDGDHSSNVVKVATTDLEPVADAPVKRKK